ncbi:hypothetical protein F0919_08975 [Taibaiella lutea]|uniref:Uncharacterized protein n=1 Tax=Taibaiella lutea TaxID=2608001 RepID=A0A5M6CHZ5_9BACT|nr:hypothetical protein [Taibaiella lutea]KAA5534734.1 hypothetical protein F0919_08975 [Taibaiella lutea]
MIVKRISYFTFMVAITTMATVSSCQKANANTISPEDFNTIVAALSEHELFDFGFQYEDASTDYNLKLQRLLKNKGLKAGTFQIKAASSGKEKVLNLILVVDKNYRGHVGSAIFDSYPDHISFRHSKSYSQSDKISLPFFAADIRKDIACRNLILLI